MIKTVSVHETEYKLKPAAISLAKTGTYVFKGVNDGTITHGLAVEGNGVNAEISSIAAGSNGGTLSGIAGWASPSPGVLAVTSIPAGVPTAGQLTVATAGGSGIVAYTGISGSTFTGCTYTGGTGTTVTTGGAVSINAYVGNSL